MSQIDEQFNNTDVYENFKTLKKLLQKIILYLISIKYHFKLLNLKKKVILRMPASVKVVSTLAKCGVQFTQAENYKNLHKNYYIIKQKSATDRYRLSRTFMFDKKLHLYHVQ